MSKLIYILSLLILGGACSDSHLPDLDTNPDTPESGVRAIVVSEGQYGYSSGSLMSVDFNGDLNYDLFKTANGSKLGDVPQSITQIGDKLYIAINNDNCVEVINSQDYKLVETLEIPHKCVPMFVEYLGNDIIAVTDQTSAAIPGAESTSKITLLNIDHSNPEREILAGTISMPVPTFQMELASDKLFVSCEEMSVFDISNLTSEGRRVLEFNGTPISSISKLVLDADGYLWALSSEALCCIDTKSEQIIKSVDMSALGCGYMDIDADGRYIYLADDCQLNTGDFGVNIYRVDTQNPTAPVKPIFTHDQSDSWTTYGVQVSPQNTIFVIRVLYGSITRSRVFEYNTQGEIVKYYDDFYGVSQPYFSAGVFSCFIHFTQE